MTLAARLAVTAIPFFVAGWLAVSLRATGASDGVLWCDALLGAVAAALVVAAWLEGRLDG